METITHNELITLAIEIISESRKTQDKRLRIFTNKITRSIMSIYSGRNSDLHFSQITIDDLGVDPSTKAEEII